MSAENPNGGPKSEDRRSFMLALAIATGALFLTPIKDDSAVEAASTPTTVTPKDLYDNFADYLGQTIQTEVIIYPGQNTGNELVLHAEVPTSKVKKLFTKKKTEAADLRRFIMQTHSQPAGTRQTHDVIDYQLEIASILPLSKLDGTYFLKGSVCTGYTGHLTKPTSFHTSIDVHELTPKPVS